MRADLVCKEIHSVLCFLSLHLFRFVVKGILLLLRLVNATVNN